jgi:hypothetical protein
VAVGDGATAATHSQTASRKFTVSRSLACGAAGEKPSNLLRAALWRHMASTAPAGVTACTTVPLSVPLGNVREMLLHPGYSWTVPPGDGRVILATGCARTNDPWAASNTVTTAVATRAMGSFPFMGGLLSL